MSELRRQIRPLDGRNITVDSDQDGRGTVSTDIIRFSCIIAIVLSLTLLMLVCTGVCDSNQFQCSRGNSCISANQECDGYINCTDTSDEAKCCKSQYSYRYHVEMCFTHNWVHK